MFIESVQVPSFSNEDGLGLSVTRLTKTRYKETAATDEEDEEEEMILPQREPRIHILQYT